VTDGIDGSLCKVINSTEIYKQGDVFKKSLPSLRKQVRKLVASDGVGNDRFGLSVSISGDGRTAIIGAFADDEPDGSDNDKGSAYIFERDGSGNWTQTQKLVASDASGNDWFGVSVSISSDGQTAIIGAYRGDGIVSDTGSAYIFERDGSGIFIQTQKLVASDGTNNDEFGNSVSISSDGKTAIIGATAGDGIVANTGSAYIFERDASGNWGDASGNENQKLVASDGASDDRFGVSVSISSDGQTAIIGAYIDDYSKGSAYIFERDGSGNWNETQKLVASDGGPPDRFGESVSISSDGKTAIIGASLYSGGKGSAYIFERDDGSGNWNETQKLVANDVVSNDIFGYSVSISGDGKNVIIGAYGDDGSKGSAYIFEPQVYLPLGIVKQDTDGSGNTKVVTSGFATVPGVVPGKVYYYNPLTNELNSVVHGTAIPTDNNDVSIMGIGIDTDTLLVQMSYTKHVAV
jgi:hypothetical protein